MAQETWGSSSPSSSSPRGTEDSSLSPKVAGSSTIASLSSILGDPSSILGDPSSILGDPSSVITSRS
ncbi:hypothetical protein FIBSPDRAFT_878922 [Athelia psychrophila]|uniref:Uncharacterized protein n=1 Tax=Athelia psychrophila TaxID=1759441 RepID=A0A167UK98_9AGAM|nr:hypothetical protein FIBSPDRAFT_878922 [Fibularhizoctonia sp. CBS 109695]